MRLQAVHPLPYSPSLVAVMPLVHGASVAQIPLQVALDVPLPLTGKELQPWMDAAKDFQMNADFDVSSAVRGRRMDLKDIMTVMKDMSVGKRTIQALADKLVLHRLLENMEVPQMPALMSIDGHVNLEDIRSFVRNYLCRPDSEDVVVKPTHLSNGTGVIVVSRPKPEEVEATIQFLFSHIQHFLTQTAGAHESVALRSLKPGFIVQPKYQSSVGFKTPLELRVIVLWGKARLALWWWGRGAAAGEFPQRNVWLVRRPGSGHSRDVREFKDEDEWEVIHEHSGSNAGFDKAVELFKAHISAIAACAESIAVGVGAPFLRSDFFVGSSRWGVRLNEVAYGCGVDYRNRTEEGRIVDDAPAMARILQEGMTQCWKKYPSEHFLRGLGVRGSTYTDMKVMPLPAWVRSPIPACTGIGVESANNCIVPEELCRTIHPLWRGRSRSCSRGPSRSSAGRSHSWDAAASRASGYLSQQSGCTFPHTRSNSLRASIGCVNQSMSFRPAVKLG